MALGRVLEVLIGESAGTDLVPVSTATLISDLDMGFNIVRNTNASSNTAAFKVYNASVETRNKILKEGNNILVYAGYEDEKNKGLIFAGTISQATTQWDAPDYVTSIKAITYTSGSKATKATRVSLSFNPGMFLSDVVKEISVSMGLAVTGIATISDLSLPNGYHFIGSLDAALQYCVKIARNNGVSIIIDNKEILIYKVGSETKLSKVLLTYDGTLLKVDNKTESKTWVSKLKNNQANGKDTVVLECLLDPRMTPSSTIALDVENHSGKYFINEVNFYGDNFGGKFNTKAKVQSVS